MPTKGTDAFRKRRREEKRLEQELKEQEATLTELYSYDPDILHNRDDYSAVDTADLPGVSPTKPGHNDLVPDRYIYKVVDHLPGATLVDVLLDWLDGKANVKFFSEDYDDADNMPPLYYTPINDDDDKIDDDKMDVEVLDEAKPVNVSAVAKGEVDMDVEDDISEINDNKLAEDAAVPTQVPPAPDSAVADGEVSPRAATAPDSANDRYVIYVSDLYSSYFSSSLPKNAKLPVYVIALHHIKHNQKEYKNELDKINSGKVWYGIGTWVYDVIKDLAPTSEVLIRGSMEIQLRVLL
jgi:hypothetical protein